MLSPASDRQVARTDNSPTAAIEAAKDLRHALGLFLEDVPVIENFEHCKDADTFIERTRAALADLEAERKPKADPLYAQWKAVNEPYSAIAKPLEKLFDIVRARVSKFKNAVEAARRAEAERLRREAEDRERAAREAEAREQEAIAIAEQVELTNVAGAIAEADESFREFQVAARTAVRAEANTTVRIASAIGGKALSMRTRRVLVVSDPQAAIKALWPNERIEAAIRTAAKDFEDAFDELPAGITATSERSM